MGLAGNAAGGTCESSELTFDGDKLNIWLIPDIKRAKQMESFSVHRGVMDVGEPMEVSGGISLHAPKIKTLNLFLSGLYRKPVEFKLREDAFT